MSAFLNMTTNSRGMLVIGMAVAAFVLAGFSALYSTGNEKAMGTGKSMEGQIKELEKEISLNQDTILERTRQLDDAEKRRSTAREADVKSALVQSNRTRIQQFEQQIPALQQAISNLERTFEEEKQRYRTQLLSNPATNAFPELKTLSGKTYQNVHLSSIDAASITFSHQDGSSRVLLKDLPAEIRSRFP
jgi:septal ring factor EnvC (AmiA/AmiB activator)